MKTKTCIKCGKLITKKSYESSKYWKTKRFCSVSCSTINRPSIWRGKKLPYPVWNKGKKLHYQVWNKGLNSKNSIIVARLGKKSGASRINKPKKQFRIMSGYKWIFIPNHPRSCKFTKCVMEQVLIMEKHLERFLKPQEVVHHINSNKLDNRLENLKLFANKSEHMRWHALYDKNSGTQYGHRIGHKVSKKSCSKISTSLKKWYKHNLHWQIKNKLKYVKPALRKSRTQK